VNARARAFEEEIRRDFPSFSIRQKRDSRLQWAIHVALSVVTLGGMRTYLTAYHTVLFGTLWVPETWEVTPDEDRYILLRHERVHLEQRRRLGDVRMTFQYLFWVLPLFLAWGRARLEWEAYEETLRATAEIHGRARAEALRERIVARFTGPDYGWMWPFPAAVNRWFDEAMRRLPQ
jgi:hypothetical protein